jgi:hypothetical protein
MNANQHESGRLPKMPKVPKTAGIKRQNLPLINTDDTDQEEIAVIARHRRDR